MTTYVANLILKLVIDATYTLRYGFIFQHCACNARLVTCHCIDFIVKHEWPPNSPDFNRLDYQLLGAMLKAYHKLHHRLDK